MIMPSIRSFLRHPGLRAAGLGLVVALLPGCKGSSSDSSSSNPPPNTWPKVLPPPVAPPTGSVPAVPTGTNGIGAVIFSQGIQDPAWVTPLVTGRDATVRVFIASPGAGNTLTPSVNVALWNAAGAQVLNQTILAPGSGIPTTPLLGDFNDSWNLDIPGTLVQPGTTFQVTLVADAQSAGLTQRTWPASGVPKALDPGLVNNQLRLTLVPVTLAASPGVPGTTGRVTTPTQTAADWVKAVRQMFPLGSGAQSLDLQVLPQAWDSGLAIVVDPFDQDRVGVDTVKVRTALERVRLATPGTAYRYYAGLFTLPIGDPLVGLGDFGQPGTNQAKTFVLGDWQPPEYTQVGGDVFNTFAHELGHCLGRFHSPCGGAAGYLVTWGLDTASHTVKDPQLNRDIMGYCPPEWISQFTYTALYRAMGLDQAAFNTAGNSATTNAIVVSGLVNTDGTVSLDPFLDVQDAPYQTEPGPFTLTLYDAQQNVVAAVPFGVNAPTDGTGSPYFCFELDLTPDQEAAVASAMVTAPAVGAYAFAPAVQVARARTVATPREPVALTWKGGVHLGWDHGIHPEVMVRDLRTGAIIATARGGAVDLATDAKDLELLMLDGIHTQVRRVTVAP